MVDLDVVLFVKFKRHVLINNVIQLFKLFVFGFEVLNGVVAVFVVVWRVNVCCGFEVSCYFTYNVVDALNEELVLRKENVLLEEVQYVKNEFCFVVVECAVFMLSAVSVVREGC